MTTIKLKAIFFVIINFSYANERESTKLFCYVNFIFFLDVHVLVIK